ncbi:MAG TPA: hypothetical protein VMD91_17455, partial [Candidatus Sulfotelmatobacter sp.]|nr:hypothetical protein [Candidatus Sulfotelmatobacter sp.]
MTRRRVLVRSIGAALAAALLALGARPPEPAKAAGSDVTVGVIYSKTGFLGSYGQQYMDGFQAGLDYATHGTGMAA